MIQSDGRHGVVVEALYNELKSIGKEGYNTKAVDLFLVDLSLKITHLFEVEIRPTTTSLYEAVGQVMFHGALESAPQRIVVLPASVEGDTAKRLDRLGIKVLHYRNRRGKPQFHNLEAVLVPSEK